MSRRGLAFALLCLVCAVVAVAAVGSAAPAHAGAGPQGRAGGRGRPPDGRAAARRRAAVRRSSAASTATTAAPTGALALAPARRRGRGRARCSRARVRARRLRRRARAVPGARRGLPSASARKILDATLTRSGSVRLPGVPSRTRVSPDGRYGAVTSFVTGHSYADVGQFSTAATIIDLERGRKRRRPREGLHDHGRRQARHGARPQLLGRDVLRATATRSTPRWPPAGRPT